MNDFDVKQKINWFPGHMNKSMRDMESKTKEIDFVIQLIDARAIDSSRNFELMAIFNNKIIITIALKSDLADFKATNNDDFIYASIHDKKSLANIQKTIATKCKAKIEQRLKKGFTNPKLYGMVVGLPNIGKSSMINFLRQKKIAIVQNRPGTTRSLSWNKISDNIYILDSPGIFFKNIDELEVGYKLAIIDCVDRKNVPKKDVLQFVFNYFLTWYKNDFSKIFDFPIPDNFDEFIETLSKNKGFIEHKNALDIERAYDFLFKYLDSKAMFRVDYDKKK
ncbi:MAG: ribosome biogenesis GTPase YlqF [Malacoplasma sp.]